MPTQYAALPSIKLLCQLLLMSVTSPLKFEHCIRQLCFRTITPQYTCTMCFQQVPYATSHMAQSVMQFML